jgi:hypothetical protein
VYFPSAPPADTKIEVSDAKGTVIQSWGILQGRGGSAGAQGGGGFNRPGGSRGIRPEAGMQRFTWDLRHPGPWAPNAPNGGGNGPLAAPGKYTVKVTTGGQTTTKTFDVKTDPRVTADGVTDVDLVEQVRFQLQVRDAISDARKTADQVDKAMAQRGIKPPAPAPPGVRPMDLKFENDLQKLWAQLNDMPGAYPQPMFISQLSNIARMVGQADQKVGKDAYDRYNDLMKELKEIQAAVAKAAAGGTL